jgi:hypothetical protein
MALPCCWLELLLLSDEAERLSELVDSRAVRLAAQQIREAEAQGTQADNGIGRG